MKVAIVGCRDWDNAMEVCHAVYDLVKELRSSDPSTIVVTGYDPEKKTPRGVDKWAYEGARWSDVPVICFPADWDGPLRKGAGFARNQQIVDASDRVVAFWDGKSHGTKDTIDRTLTAHKHLEVRFP